MALIDFYIISQRRKKLCYYFCTTGEILKREDNTTTTTKPPLFFYQHDPEACGATSDTISVLRDSLQRTQKCLGLICFVAADAMYQPK